MGWDGCARAVDRRRSDQARLLAGAHLASSVRESPAAYSFFGERELFVALEIPTPLLRGGRPNLLPGLWVLRAEIEVAPETANSQNLLKGAGPHIVS